MIKVFLGQNDLDICESYFLNPLLYLPGHSGTKKTNGEQHRGTQGNTLTIEGATAAVERTWVAFVPLEIL